MLRQKHTRVKSVAFREHSKGYIFVHPCSLPIMTSVRYLLGYGHTPPHCYKHYLINRPTLCSFQHRWQILCSLHTDEPSSDLACRTGPSNIGTVSAFVSTAPPPNPPPPPHHYPAPSPPPPPHFSLPFSASSVSSVCFAINHKNIITPHLSVSYNGCLHMTVFFISCLPSLIFPPIKTFYPISLSSFSHTLHLVFFDRRASQF